MQTVETFTLPSTIDCLHDLFLASRPCDAGKVHNCKEGMRTDAEEKLLFNQDRVFLKSKIKTLRTFILTPEGRYPLKKTKKKQHSKHP